MSIKSSMNGWGREYLLERNPDAEIPVDADIDFEDGIYYGGYCETCSYEEYRVTVSYGHGRSYVARDWYESMSELMAEIMTWEAKHGE